jgi:hypothetical protein
VCWPQQLLAERRVEHVELVIEAIGLVWKNARRASE